MPNDFCARLFMHLQNLHPNRPESNFCTMESISQNNALRPVETSNGLFTSKCVCCRMHCSKFYVEYVLAYRPKAFRKEFCSACAQKNSILIVPRGVLYHFSISAYAVR
jgi:hypothetical protein